VYDVMKEWGIQVGANSCLILIAEAFVNILIHEGCLSDTGVQANRFNKDET